MPSSCWHLKRHLEATTIWNRANFFSWWNHFWTKEQDPHKRVGLSGFWVYIHHSSSISFTQTNGWATQYTANIQLINNLRLSFHEREREETEINWQDQVERKGGKMRVVDWETEGGNGSWKATGGSLSLSLFGRPLSHFQFSNLTRSIIFQNDGPMIEWMWKLCVILRVSLGQRSKKQASPRLKKNGWYWFVSHPFFMLQKSSTVCQSQPTPVPFFINDPCTTSFLLSLSPSWFSISGHGGWGRWKG